MELANKIPNSNWITEHKVELTVTEMQKNKDLLEM